MINFDIIEKVNKEKITNYSNKNRRKQKTNSCKYKNQKFSHIVKIIIKTKKQLINSNKINNIFL